jgi:hypothetical protein
MAYERKTFDLIISEEFRSILLEIESDSLVAKLLLKKRHNKEDLVDDPINFISFSSTDKTKISYLTTDRISKIEDPSLYWSSSRRFAIKPGGLISKLFKDIPSREVEKFSNLYRAEVRNFKTTIKVVEGVDIIKYYSIDSYVSERGSLGASCMKHDSCQDYFGIYTENNNKVKLLVMLNDDGELIGRALLWNLDDMKIMDRIYTISDEDFAFKFKKWATDNDYLYKSEQNWYNTLFFENLNTQKKELRIDVKLDNSQFRNYPYVDTFKFLNRKEGVLTNYKPVGDFETLACTYGGTKEKNYFEFDSICKIFRNPCDVVYLNYLNIYTHPNNTRYSYINNDYILYDDCSYDDLIDEWIFNEENDKFNSEKVNKKRESIRMSNKEGEKKDDKYFGNKMKSFEGDINGLLETLGLNTRYFANMLDLEVPMVEDLEVPLDGDPVDEDLEPVE